MISKRPYLYSMLVCLWSLLLSRSAALAHDALSIGNASADEGQVASIPLLLSSDGDVQGFVMVFEWDGARAEGVEVTANDGAGAPLAGADLIVTRAEDAFMILSVVMDADGRDGEKIPAGDGIRVGTARIRCSGGDGAALRLVDGKHATVDGGPLLSNLIAVGGRSIRAEDGLELENGQLSCEGAAGTGVIFACGGALSGGKPRKIEGAADSEQTVTFYYQAPATGRRERIQAFSMALLYECDLAAIEDSFDEDGGVLDEVNAEFIHVEADNRNPTQDEDGCELTVGVLIDAKSPFDGRTLPPADSLEKLFTIDFLVEDDAPCGDCLPIRFRDGLNGSGTTEVFNIATINFQSVKPELQNCSICVQSEPKFIRGNCNLSSGRPWVDISDAVAVVGFVFLEGDDRFDAPCEDACDGNDDGRLDAGDVVFILNYLFVPGKPKPPTPGPTAPGGVDPTDDRLTCDIEGGDC